MLDGSNRRGKTSAPTIKDVAAAAGVSIATVSAVLNGTSKVSVKRTHLVREAVDKLSYAPNEQARSLRLGRSRFIALIVGDIANPFFTSLIRAIERRASEAGYLVMVANSGDDASREEELIRSFREQRVAGIILAPAGYTASYTDALRKSNDVPFVIVDRQLPGDKFDTVVMDNWKAAYVMVQYLLRLGHQRIAIIYKDDHLSTTYERLRGYKSALTEAGLPREKVLQQGVKDGHKTTSGALSSIINGSKPATAVFCANNALTLETLAASLDMGLRCPEDLSISGVDEVPWGDALRPKMTTISQPIDEIGRNALSLLFQRIDRDDQKATAPQTRSLEPRLFIQSSCASPPIPQRNVEEERMSRLLSGHATATPTY